MKPVILLTGRSGQVGSELLPRLQQFGQVIAPNRSKMDLTRAEEIRRTVSECRPQLIVNAAAYTAVDRAETEEAAARAVNAEAPAILAEGAKKIGAALVHFSTDYVFDGTKDAPYDEDDLPNPLNVYGRTKLAGEEAIRASGVAHLIFRSSWIYAKHGKNFPVTILRLAAERDELRVVDDQIGAPTCAADLAVAVEKILGSRFCEPNVADAISKVSGTYHATACGETSWYEFALAILAEAPNSENTSRSNLEQVGELQGTPQKRRRARLIPITTEEFGAPAQRPRYSVLSNEKLQRTLGVALPDWREQLRGCFGAGVVAPTPMVVTAGKERV